MWGTPRSTVCLAWHAQAARRPPSPRSSCRAPPAASTSSFSATRKSPSPSTTGAGAPLASAAHARLFCPCFPRSRPPHHLHRAPPRCSTEEAARKHPKADVFINYASFRRQGARPPARHVHTRCCPARAPSGRSGAPSHTAPQTGGAARGAGGGVLMCFAAVHVRWRPQRDGLFSRGAQAGHHPHRGHHRRGRARARHQAPRRLCAAQQQGHHRPGHRGRRAGARAARGHGVAWRISLAPCRGGRPAGRGQGSGGRRAGGRAGQGRVGCVAMLLELVAAPGQLLFSGDVAQAGAFKIGDTAGTLDNIVACKLHRPGSVGFVSKSGGMSNELYNVLARATDGLFEGACLAFGGQRAGVRQLPGGPAARRLLQPTRGPPHTPGGARRTLSVAAGAARRTDAGIAIGGDTFPGSTLCDHCLRYQNIPEVRARCSLRLTRAAGVGASRAAAARRHGCLVRGGVLIISLCRSR